MADLTRGQIERLVADAQRHGLTLTNGGDDVPEWRPHYDPDEPATLIEWRIEVSGARVAVVPATCDGDDLTDWRDAICAAGPLLMQTGDAALAALTRAEAAEAEVARLRERVEAMGAVLLALAAACDECQRIADTHTPGVDNDRSHARIIGEQRDALASALGPNIGWTRNADRIRSLARGDA